MLETKFTHVGIKHVSNYSNILLAGAIPQGSALGPLWYVYVNEMPLYIGVAWMFTSVC